MARNNGTGQGKTGGKRPGYNPLNEGYTPNGQKGYTPKGNAGGKTPSPPKGGTAASRPTSPKK